MENQPQPVDAATPEPAKPGFPRWVIIALVVFALCCCLSLLVIAVMTLLGPAIGNIFSSINQSL